MFQKLTLREALDQNLVRSKLLGLCPEISPTWCIYSSVYLLLLVSTSLVNFFKYIIDLAMPNTVPMLCLELFYTLALLLFSTVARIQMRKRLKSAVVELESVDGMLIGLGYPIFYNNLKLHLDFFLPLLPVLSINLFTYRMYMSIFCLSLWQVTGIMMWVMAEEILMQFTTLVYFVGERLKSLNCILCDKILKTYVIEKLLEAHSRLASLASEANKIYSVRMLFLVLGYFIFSVTTAHIMISNAIHNGFVGFKIEIISSTIAWLVSTLLILQHMVSTCETAAMQVNK
jgi:hypothetical protein